jgi:SH3-like domain-containing protein
MYSHRTRNITIASALILGLGALTLIPADRGGAAAVALPSVSSPKTIATIDAMLDTTPVAPIRPAAEESPNIRPASTATLETAALETEIPAKPALDPSLRPDAIGSKAVNLRTGPSSSTAALTVLQPGQSLHVGTSQDGWVEVTLDDGTKGWVYSRYLASVAAASPQETVEAEAPEAKAVASVESDELAGRTARIEGRLTVKSKPSAGGRSLFRTEPGERVRILAVQGDWLKIRTADGTVGWIERA